MGQNLRNIIVILAIVTVCGAIGTALVIYAGASIMQAVIGVIALFAAFVSLYNNQIQFGQFSQINRQLQDIHSFERRISGQLRDLDAEKRNDSYVRAVESPPENEIAAFGKTVPISSNLTEYNNELSADSSILSELVQPKPQLGIVDDVPDIEGENSTLDPSEDADQSDNVIPLVRRSSIGDIAANINALVNSIHLKPSQLAGALKSEDLELYLQPTLRIPSREVTFFEASVHISVQDEKYDQTQFGQVALDARQMPAIDQMALPRAFHIVRFLQRQGSNLPLFLEISPQTLRNNEAMDQIVEYLSANKAVCEMLVYELPQREFEKLNANQRQNLARIRDIGFKLCLKQFVDNKTIKRIIEHDLFSYLKIPAAELMRIGGADILNFADEIVPDAHSRNITLIASDVENEGQVVAMIDADVFLVQGNGLVRAKPLKKELDAGNM